MNTPLVTVITVTYNSSQYVRDAIESVLAQSYENIEYIIADDASTDNTWDIINEYKDARIIKYQNEINLGQWLNRNKAIDLANGKYLLFLDGDDIVYSHGVEIFVRNAEQYPEAALTCQIGYVNNVIFPFQLNSNEIFKNSYFGKFRLLSNSFSSNFFKTEVLKKVGKLKTIYKTGDEEVRLRIAIKYPILFISASLTWARETPNSVSSTLKNGIGLIEEYLITKDILSKHELGNHLLSMDILKIINYKISRFYISSFIRLNFSAIRNLNREIQFSIIDIYGGIINYKTIQTKDILLSYTPSNPFKRII